MKFRFCGELDAPDWLLKEISLLSKISVVRVRLLCTQVLNRLLGSDLEYEKVNKLTKDANLDTSDVKAAIAALTFILVNGAKYNVEDGVLSNELQQLGLPKEHGDSLAKPYRDNKQKLRDMLTSQTLKLQRLESVDWRVDYLLASSDLPEINHPTVQLKLNIKDPQDGSKTIEQSFEVSADKLSVLLAELKHAREIMGTL